MMNSETIKTEIDNDTGLQSKRKHLIILSTILFAISFSGATIEEANTFIFNIRFTNQNGLAFLLFLSIPLSIIRYYNYASPYHKRIFLVWSKRLLKDPFFYLSDQYHQGDEGIVANARPAEIEELLSYIYEDRKLTKWNFTYQRGLLSRSILYNWSYDYLEKQCEIHEEKSINIYRHFGLKIYLITVKLEMKERIKSLFIHRENLDIYSPYILGVLAIFSYYFHTELSELLECIIPAKKT